MANIQNVLNALDPYNGEPDQLEKFIAAAEQEFGPNWTDTILQEMTDIPPLYREKLMHAFNYHAALTAWNEAQNYLMQPEPLDPAEITERIPVLEHWLAFFGAPGAEVVAQVQQKLDEQQKNAPAAAPAPATPAAPSESTPTAADSQPETQQTPAAQQEAVQDKTTPATPQPDVQKEQPETPAAATQQEPEPAQTPAQPAADVQETPQTPAPPAETADQPKPATPPEQPEPQAEATQPATPPEQPASGESAESNATPTPPEQPKPTESTPQPAPTESKPTESAPPQQSPEKPDAVQTPVKADDEATWQVQKIFKQADLLETVQSWITARCVDLGQIEVFTYPCYGFLVDMMEQTLKEVNAVLENTVLTARINDIVPDGLEKLKKMQQSINADLDIAYQNIESHPTSLVNPELNRSDLKNILGKIDTSTKPEYIGQAPDGFESIDDPYAKPAPAQEQPPEQPQAPAPEQPPSETPDAKNDGQNENTSSQSPQNGVQRKLSFSFGKKKPTAP